METQPVETSAITTSVAQSGAGEKSVVSWHDDGATQDSTVVVTQGFMQRGGDAASDTTTSDTRLEVPLTTKVSASGDDRAIISEVGTPHGSNAALNQDVGTAKGFRAQWHENAQGEMHDLRYGAPESATNTARAGLETSLGQLHSLPVVFPKDAIGVGAMWTAENTIQTGSEFSQKVTYTLLKRSGDTVELDLKVVQAPTTTELDPGQGTKLKVIDSSTETLSGKLTINLGKPLPVAGIVDYVTSITYGDGASDVRITQRYHRALEFR